MNTIKTLALALLAVLVLSLPASAQTYLTNTTLSAAVTSTTSRTISVTSATGFTVGYMLYVDGEAMTISSVSGTSIGVFRGAQSTVAATHTSASVVFVGPPQAFQNQDPPVGSCTASNSQYLPIINVLSGNVWLCRSFGSSGVTASAQWTATNVRFITYNSLLKNLQ